MRLIQFADSPPGSKCDNALYDTRVRYMATRRELFRTVTPWYAHTPLTPLNSMDLVRLIQFPDSPPGSNCDIPRNDTRARYTVCTPWYRKSSVYANLVECVSPPCAWKDRIPERNRWNCVPFVLWLHNRVWAHLFVMLICGYADKSERDSFSTGFYWNFMGQSACPITKYGMSHSTREFQLNVKGHS